MASIETRRQKDGTVSYRARVRLRGQPAIYATFRRKTDAKAWATSMEAAVREKRYFPGSEAERRALGEAAERFIAEMLPLRSSRDRGRAANQLRWWVEKIGEDTRLAEVTPAVIVEARDRLARGDSPSGKPASPATVKRYLAILSRMFSVAVKEWYWLEDNPCRRVTRPSEPRGRVRFLSDDERDRLLEVCRESHDPRLSPLVLMALSTGARQGELLALRWRDVDMTRGMATVHDSKNGERRALSLSGAALEGLREHSRVRRIDSDLLFVGPRGRPSFPRIAWDKAVADAELDDFHFHDLRHTTASYLAMSGATLAEIAEVLGQKTLAMVKRYSHLTESHTRSVVERMNQRFLP